MATTAWCAGCPRAPCLCPEPGYGFLGLSPVLHGHLAERHQWPVTDIAYGSMLDWSWRYRCKVWVHTPVDADTDHMDAKVRSCVVPAWRRPWTRAAGQVPASVVRHAAVGMRDRPPSLHQQAGQGKEPPFLGLMISWSVPVMYLIYYSLRKEM